MPDTYVFQRIGADNFVVAQYMGGFNTSYSRLLAMAAHYTREEAAEYLRHARNIGLQTLLLRNGRVRAFA